MFQRRSCGARAIGAFIATLALVTEALQAAPIEIPNGSFESPATVFVDINIDGWQKTPKPPDFSEEGGFLWTQLTGLFKNTPPGAADHIVNCDGNQAVWLFAVPGVGLFQEAVLSGDETTSAPTNFVARFEPGKAYKLTVGVIGGGGGMLQGATLEIGLYYRDASSNAATVASTTITHFPGLFPDRNHLIDFEVRVPVVSPTDPWAGKGIGVRLDSGVSTNLQGGYWDMDHVRLAETIPPEITSFACLDEGFRLTVSGDPETTVEFLAADQPALDASLWTSLGIVTNAVGVVSFVDPTPGLARRFYRARQFP